MKFINKKLIFTLHVALKAVKLNFTSNVILKTIKSTFTLKFVLKIIFTLNLALKQLFY